MKYDIKNKIQCRVERCQEGAHWNGHGQTQGLLHLIECRPGGHNKRDDQSHYAVTIKGEAC